MSAHDERRGPVEDHDWPDRLSARVASAGERPVIHGYSIAGDLARHYSFGEQTLLALTGALPDEATGRAFEWAMQLLGATSVADAPAHTAVVVRLCGASPGAAFAAGFTAATELATAMIDRHAALIAWLEGGGAYPAEHAGDGALAAEARARLALEVPALACSPTDEAALIAILHRCGLCDPAQIVGAVALAKLPVVMGEAIAQRPLGFRGYPMNVPDFVALEIDR